MAIDIDKQPHVIMADGKWLGGSFKDKASAEAAANSMKIEERKAGKKERSFQVAPKSSLPKLDANKPHVFGQPAPLAPAPAAPASPAPAAPIVEDKPLDLASTVDVKTSESKSFRK